MHGGIPIPEAAAALGISERTVRRRIKAGTLDAYEVHTVHGMSWRVVLPADDGGQDTGDVAMVESTIAKPVDSERLGVVLAEVQVLREQVAALQPLYGPHDPGPPVVLRYEEYPSEDTMVPVEEDEPAQGIWTRVKAWLGGGG